MKRILFVCSANSQRSPAFEREMKLKVDKTKFEIRSAGCWTGYPYRVDQEILQWADYVYVMDLSHKIFIHQRYKDYLLKVKVIGISDQYDTDSGELKELITYWYETEFKPKFLEPNRLGKLD